MREGFHHGKHMPGSGHSGNQTGYCVCPACGYKTMHTPGIPCKTMNCPNCGTGLHKAIPAALKTNNNEALTHRVAVKTNQVMYPKVNEIKCTGCGKCIDTCPTGTIQLINQKAFIETSNCRQCNLCVRICKEHAINLE